MCHCSSPPSVVIFWKSSDSWNHGLSPTCKPHVRSLRFTHFTRMWLNIPGVQQPNACHCNAPGFLKPALSSLGAMQLATGPRTCPSNPCSGNGNVNNVCVGAHHNSQSNFAHDTVESISPHGIQTDSQANSTKATCVITLHV